MRDEPKLPCISHLSQKLNGSQFMSDADLCEASHDREAYASYMSKSLKEIKNKRVREIEDNA